MIMVVMTLEIMVEKITVEEVELLVEDIKDIIVIPAYSYNVVTKDNDEREK